MMEAKGQKIKIILHAHTHQTQSPGSFSHSLTKFCWIGKEPKIWLVGRASFDLISKASSYENAALISTYDD
jgi:hypothetical protein